MAAAPKSRMGTYLAFGILGAGGYYFYRAGGDPKVAKEEMQHDMHRARAHAPGGSNTAGERAGEKAGLETNFNLDEAANNPKSTDLATQAQKKFDDLSAAGKDQANRLSKEAEEKAGKLKGEAEDKAAEAKSTVSGWFGGKK
ncbi:hypothetical protein BDV18DRAFT_130870 [Aspergillus unguis]